MRPLSSLATAALLAGSIVGAAHTGAGGLDAVRLENAKIGTPDWQGVDDRGRAVEVYASATDALRALRRQSPLSGAPST